jgi:hypothetical protein
MMIDPKLREEISMKKVKIDSNSASYGPRRRMVKENLQALGDVYSFWIENPELRKLFLLENKTPPTLKKQARKGISYLNNAWYYLVDGSRGGSFIDRLGGETIASTNALVNGFDHTMGRFRTNDVLLMKHYAPPVWQDVPEKVAEALSDIKTAYTQDPLEGAIKAHLSLALIQPFDSANKRTARLIQDRLLYESGLPPAVIQAGEARFYLDMLCKTAIPYQDRDMDGQKQFYNYVASKVNNGLDEILGDLDI